MSCLRAFLLACLAGCGVPSISDEPRVSPLDLIATDRVVMTPGARVTVHVDIQRAEPEPEHPVLLELLGGGGDVTATLDTALTKGNTAVLQIATSPTAVAQEATLVIRGQLGPYGDLEPVVVSVQVPSVAGSDSAEAYAPGVVGVVETIEIDGTVLSYEVIDGLAILDGDMVLGDAATLASRLRARSATCNPDFRSDFFCSRWTDGVVGYTFADDWGDAATNSMMRVRIEAAIDHWEAETGLRFVRRSTGEHIEFRNGMGCWSTVGRAIITGLDSQSITLAPGCGYGTTIHEIGHAIGLFHEQSRADRDDYVRINLENVTEGRESQFAQKGDALRDRGAYDYGSIMHYPPDAFARNPGACNDGRSLDPPDFSACTIYPTNPPTAGIGQRDLGLSDGDILGAYMLYPPRYSITGAVSGATGDRFNLQLHYETPANGEHVVWTSNRVATPLGTGNSITIRAADVAPGLNVITATFSVANVVVTSRSIVLNFENAAPAVTLAATNGKTRQHLGQPFMVAATISDTEDGTCEGCTITWDPTPSEGPSDTRTAIYNFSTEGPRTITVTVEDRAGARTSASLTVDIFNTPPTVTIVAPAQSIVVAEGVSVLLDGRGEDINNSFGQLPCSALRWSSSNAADVFSTTVGCTSRVHLVGTGPRTITLIGTDNIAYSAPATVKITATTCDSAGCAPTAYFDLSPPNSGDAYFIEREIRIEMHFGDVEVNSPVTYRMLLRRAGSPDVEILRGSEPVYDPSALAIEVDWWTPAPDVGNGWNNCTSPSEYRDYQLVLEATDSAGSTTTTARTITLGCDLI